MTRMQLKTAVTAAIASLLIGSSALVRATTVNVTIDSPFLTGQPAVLAFDFIDGSAPDNSVTLSPLTFDGTLKSTSITGNITGSGPWTFSDAGGSAFNELQVAFDPMGTSLSFSFQTSDNPPAGPLPDGFSLVVLDSSGILPLITTNDPTGANSLFLFSIGQGSAGLEVFTADQQGFVVSATPIQSLPEPSSMALVLCGALVWLSRVRSRWVTRRFYSGACRSV